MANPYDQFDQNPYDQFDQQQPQNPIPQFAGGFNRALSQYTEAPERLAIMATDLARLKRPDWAGTAERANITNFLRSSTPPATTQGGRFLSRVGEEFGMAAPYAAGALAGAPIVAEASKMFSGPVSRAVMQISQGIANSPLAASLGEILSIGGSGIGAAVAQKYFPGNQGAEAAGQLVGGLSPVVAGYAPTSMALRGANAIRNQLSPEATTRRAMETVQNVIGPELGPRAREGLRTGEQLRRDIPGYEPSLAETTGSPALISTQRAIESRAAGPALERVTGRRESNIGAVQSYAEQQRPEGAGPSYVVNTATRQIKDLTGRIGKARAETRAQAADIVPVGAVDRADIGAGLRSSIGERQNVERVRMAKLADDLGIGDADLSVQFAEFQDKLRDSATRTAFEDRSNVPSVIKEILEYGRRTPDSMRSMLRQIRNNGNQRPTSLMQFLRSKGGIRDDAGELRARDFGGRGGLLNNKTGRPLDELALVATEAGYFPGKTRATPDELLEALDQEARGRPVYSEFDYAAAARADDLDAFRRELDQAGVNLNLPDDEIVRRMDFDTGNKANVSVTFNDLMGLRSRISDDIRDAMSSGTPSAKKVRALTELERQVDNFINKATETADPGLASRYAEFRNRYKTDYVDRFRQGAAFRVRSRDGRGYYQVPDERVAQQFLKDVSGARQFKRTFGEDAPETAALESVLIDDLRAYAVRDGELKQNLVAAWLRQKEPVLKEFPQIERGLRNTAQRNAAIQDRMATLANRERRIERSLLNKELESFTQGGRTAEAVIADAINNPRLMRQITSAVRGDPGAVAAMKRAVWDQAADMTPADMRAFINKPTVKQVLGEQHAKALNNIATAMEQMARVPAPAGRPYDPSGLEAVERRLGSGINQISSRIFAAQSGRTSWRYIGIDMLSRFLRGNSRNEVAAILEGALYDPAVAKNIVDMIRLPDKRPLSAKRLNTWLFNVGASEPASDDRK